MEAFSERRKRLLEKIDGALVLFSAPVAVRNNDVEHEYRQDSDLYYLTGFTEPSAALVLTTRHEQHRLGTVITVEPGIYVRQGDATAHAEYRGIGVRIEDDVLVTATGHRELTADIPRSVDDVERACRT
jgi:Xaa-Pro aminopeptidase